MKNQAMIDAVLAADQILCEALIAADTGLLAALLADEFRYVHAGGRVESRQAYIDSIAARTFRFIEFSRTNVAVNVYGETAVVAGDVSATRDDAQDVGVTPFRSIGPFRFVGVWVKTGTAWRLVLWQHTKMI
jgi:hypothetical protein